VLVGEVGVMGYVLDQAEIFDSSGINSPVIYRLRRERDEGARDGASKDAPQWVLLAMERLKPDWVVSLPQFLGVDALVRNPAQAPQYVVVSGLPLSAGRVVVLRRSEDEIFSGKNPSNGP